MALDEFAANPKAVKHPRPDMAAKGIKVKLGKKPKKEDKRNVQLVDYVDRPKLFPARPAHAFYGYKVDWWPMYSNSRYGDCTCAAVGHMEQCWSANVGVPETPTEKNVLDLYWATGDQDDGRYCIDIMNRWRNIGFGPDAQGKMEKIIGYAEVDVKDIEMVKTACWLFGGLYLGVALPNTARSQYDRWTYDASAPASDREPGSWGGHAIDIVAYSDYNLWLITWGYKMKMSWGFWKHYVDECYAIISPDWVQKGVAPSGFNLAALQSDLSNI